MRISRPQRFILFTLGKCYEASSKRFVEKPLELSLSKAAFIDLALKAGITQKKIRSLYKNLESLEKNKLIFYKNKNLFLTAKGNKLFEKIRKNMEPFINVLLVLSSDDLFRYTKKARTIFKHNI